MRWKAYLFGGELCLVLGRREKKRQRWTDRQTDTKTDRENLRQKDRETREEAGRGTSVSAIGGHITVEYQTDTKIERT